MTFKIIPAIDIIDGNLVRLYKGDYDMVTSYEQTPKEMALYYQSLGLNYIHVVDLNGAKDGDLINLDVIRSIAELPNIQIQVGGGIRTPDHIQLLLDAGVSAVIIGSMFVQDFTLASQLTTQYPNQVIAGLDILHNKLASHGWTKSSSMTIDDMLKSLVDLPLHSIVSTDISKDGTFEGLNYDFYQRLSDLSSHPIIASGGVSTIDDVINLRNLNLPNMNGCIVGKAIIEGRLSKSDIENF